MSPPPPYEILLLLKQQETDTADNTDEQHRCQYAPPAIAPPSSDEKSVEVGTQDEKESIKTPAGTSLDRAEQGGQQQQPTKKQEKSSAETAAGLCFDIMVEQRDPPDLQRTSPGRLATLPGAYAEAPGESSRRLSSSLMDHSTTLSASYAEAPGAFSRRLSSSLVDHSASLLGSYAEAPGELPRRLSSLEDYSQTEEAQDRESAADGLVEARPVEDVDLEEARSLELAPCPRSSESKSESGGNYFSRRRCIAAAMVTCFVAASILLVVTMARRNIGLDDDDDERPLVHADEPMMTLNPEPITSEDYLKSVLPAESVQAALNNAVSSQKMAFDWLLQDPSLETYAQVRLFQRFALATLYYATQGHLWKNSKLWLAYEHHECSWHSGSSSFSFGEPPEEAASPCSEEGMYERLWLMKNNLNGTLPDEIYGLSTLRSINLAKNSGLVGTISPKIHRLAGNLNRFIFTKSSLSGTLPSEIGLLSHLELLYASTSSPNNSTLHGTVPTELGQLAALEQLALTKNRLSGTLPSQIGQLTKLKLLAFKENRLTGTLPNQIGGLTVLEYAFFYDNALSGTIPTSFGLLDDLYYLHLHMNHLHGPVPSELGLLGARLNELLLSNNTLTGEVPSQLGLLTDLNMLYLSHNAGLSGSLPSELSQQLTSLSAFDVSGTSIVVASSNLSGTALEEAQDMDFNRFYYECNHRLPCS